MAARIRVYAITVPNGSTSAITTAHGEGETPSWMLLFSHGGTATGLATGHCRQLLGMTDGTRSYGWGAQLQDNVAGVADVEQQGNTGVIGYEMDYSTNAVTGSIQFTSWDATDFVITPNDAFVADMVITVVLGFDFAGAYVDAFSTAASGADITRTGIPFQPDCVIATGFTASLGLSPSTSNFNIGVASASAQWAATMNRADATSNYTSAAFKTGRLAMQGFSLGDEYALLNFTADGGVIDRVVGTAARALALLWLQGGAPVVGTFASRTSPGTTGVSTSGHTSGGVLVACRPGATASDSAAVEAGEIIIGAGSSPTNSMSVWQFEPNNETLGGGNVTDPLGYHDNAVIYHRRTRTGTDTTSSAAVFDISAINYGTVTMDHTTADVATLVGYVSWGDPTPPATGGAYYHMLLEAHA